MKRISINPVLAGFIIVLFIATVVAVLNWNDLNFTR